MNLPERFDRHLSALRLPAGPALVAVSGGGDSLALLELLVHAPAAAGFQLIVAHVDHGIAPDSAGAADRVAAAAIRCRLPCHLATLRLGPGTSETRSREARYAELFRMADEAQADVIFTGHQQDDQVETILMRLLRGSAPAGLAGMASRRDRIVRPLLPFRREELAEYLHSTGITPWDDPANRDPRHQRSWIRTTLLPALRRRIPEVDRRLVEVGHLAAADRAAWEALLDQLPGLDFRAGSEGVSVAATPLTGYDSGVVRGLVGALGRRAGCTIGPRRAGRLERLLHAGRSGAVLELGTGYSAELSFGRLHLRKAAEHPTAWPVREVQGSSGRSEAGGWLLDWRHDAAPPRIARNEQVSWFADGSYLVRPWRAGDRIRPLGGQGRRLVVRCMQDVRIARSARAAWPVVERAGTIVWVPGVCRAAEFVPPPGSPALRIDAHLR